MGQMEGGSEEEPTTEPLRAPHWGNKYIEETKEAYRGIWPQHSYIGSHHVTIARNITGSGASQPGYGSAG